MTQVLIIEDDLTVATSTERWLTMNGFKVLTCHDANKVMSILNEHDIDVVLSDVKMPHISGLELQQKINFLDAQLPVILMTGHGDIAMAVNAMEQGAYYFIEKPFEPEHLSQIIKRAANKRQLEVDNRRLQNQLSYISGIDSRLIGTSLPMMSLRKQVLSLASFDASVVIHGDTGTGKELVANCLHDYSHRSDHPFVAINCGAIPENLLESELFGHEKGAFTGASQTRIGKLEYASKGTLFLDEIESMPMSFQVKLLRALQENTIERVGSNKSITINPRVICATKVDLKKLSEQGDFRLDLYYRLKIANLNIPKLEQRLDDIPILFQHFLEQACHKYKVKKPTPSMEDIVLLTTRSWPGNIRELKNLAQQYVISNVSQEVTLASLLTKDGYQTDVLDGSLPTASLRSLAEQVGRFEEYLLRNAMRESRGRIKDVIDLLQVSRRNLNLKMQRYNINRSDYL
ncbi:MAG: sigma-54-dependent Fis family transcriptional regulator [Alteromonadaceae bacterium]|nr:sigma-54-dependent Fis family transcriptional regulator [Alteromonadaceae bacterium]